MKKQKKYKYSQQKNFYKICQTAYAEVCTETTSYCHNFVLYIIYMTYIYIRIMYVYALA